MGGQADRGGPREPRLGSRGQARRRPQQRRRPLQPLAVLGVDEPGRRRRARRARSPRRSTARSARSTTSRRSSRTPASTSSAPAGRGSSHDGCGLAVVGTPNQDTPISTARRRCWASTSGSTRTTSSTRTSARTTSTRGGTSVNWAKVGERYARASPDTVADVCRVRLNCGIEGVGPGVSVGMLGPVPSEGGFLPNSSPAPDHWGEAHRMGAQLPNEPPGGVDLGRNAPSEPAILALAAGSTGSSRPRNS